MKNYGSILINTLLKLPIPSRLRLWLRTRFAPPYETLAGVYGMPKLNLLNQETSEYFLRVAEYWIKEADIDGWRLDVAHRIPSEFWKKFRSRIKALKPNIYLLGELWNNCEVSQWVGDEAFDTVMNYPLRSAILDFFVYEKIGVYEFDYRLAKLRAKLPRKALFVMYNLLGSHDTPRFLTLCRGDVRKAKLTILFQMSFPGTPAIYYGDEVGLVGGGDPDCRRTMIWNCDEWNMKLFSFYKEIIKIRRKHPALVLGDFNVILKDEKKKLYGYRRTLCNEEIITIINNSKEKAEIQLKVDNECRLIDLLTAKDYKSYNRKVTLEIEFKNGLLLKKESLLK